MLKIHSQNSFIKNRKGSYLRGPTLSQWSSTAAANLHGLIDEVEMPTGGLIGHLLPQKIGPNCGKLGLRDGFGSPNM